MVVIDVDLSPAVRVRIQSLSASLRLLDGISEATISQADVIYTGRADFNPSQAPNLRWIQTNSAAVESLPSRPVAASGIPVANVRGAYTVAVAEMAVQMMLALVRRFGDIHSLQLDRRWPTEYAPLAAERCHGKRLGIVGYGSIGRQVGRIAKAMGMPVLACKRRPEIRQEQQRGFRFPDTGDPDGEIPEAWFGPDEIAEMFKTTDIAVMTLPATTETRSIVGRRELEALPASAYLVNIGRGAVLDEQALIECLQSGGIAGAALDVFAEEPLDSQSPLWTMENVLVAPHLGSYTNDQRDMAAEVLIENLSRYLNNRPLLDLVDLARGY